jgi:hypothetical protein
MSTFILLLCVCLGSIVAFRMLRSGETIRFETSAVPRQIVMAAVGIVAGRRHWQTLSQGDTGASFRYDRGPNKLIALALLLCFLVPGIVYLVLAGKRESLALYIDDSLPGMTVVQLTSTGFRGKAAGRALRRQIGLVPGALGANHGGGAQPASQTVGEQVVAGEREAA